MDFDEMKKELHIKNNWRAHVANYFKLKKQEKVNSPERYCEQQKINSEAFNAWLKHIEREDKYIFYVNFATEYISRAKRSLDLIEDYKDVSKLKMPLLRDVIIAYAAPFTNSYGRISNRFHLEEDLIPHSLMPVHRKVCADRDQVIGHCDIGARDPRVSLIGTSIRMAGYYWKDYEVLIPDFKKLILAVQENLNKYNQETFTPMEVYFQDSINSPKCADEDPGPLSENIP
jgi:hypothetical protein